MLTGRAMAHRHDAPVPVPTWDTTPTALVRGQTLVAISTAAAKAGVSLRMRLPEAQATCAALETRPWDDRAISRAVTEVTAALVSTSPQVTPATGAIGTWWIGANGFGAPDSAEPALARAILAIAQCWHPHARVAIADSCVAARAATWSTPESSAITIVPPGACATFLAPHSTALIPMDAELREALAALGARTIGAFAAFDAGDVESRWGTAGLASWRLAHGDDPRRPGLTRLESSRAVHTELPHAVDTTTPVGFLIRASLERLVADLVRDGRAAASVAITLTLDHAPHTTHHSAQYSTPNITPQYTSAITHQPHASHGAHSITREVRPAQPLARVEPLVEQCRALLEQWTLPAPVIGVTVHIPATAPLSADQGDLLLPSWHDTAASMTALVTRLVATLDPQGRGDVVVVPHTANAHGYDRTAQWRTITATDIAQASQLHTGPQQMPQQVSLFTSHTTVQQTAQHTPNTIPHTLRTSGHDSAPQPTRRHPDDAALRLLDPPAVVDVTCTHGVPRTLQWEQQLLTLTQPHGPEQLVTEWWLPNPITRTYWRCHADGEGTLLLYEADNTWYVHGWYD
jgi:protein ImuB